jgi:hypothetical protein
MTEKQKRILESKIRKEVKNQMNEASEGKFIGSIMSTIDKFEKAMKLDIQNLKSIDTDLASKILDIAEELLQDVVDSKSNLKSTK